MSSYVVRTHDVNASQAFCDAYSDTFGLQALKSALSPAGIAKGTGSANGLHKYSDFVLNIIKCTATFASETSLGSLAKSAPIVKLTQDLSAVKDVVEVWVDGFSEGSAFVVCEKKSASSETLKKTSFLIAGLSDIASYGEKIGFFKLDDLASRVSTFLGGSALTGVCAIVQTVGGVFAIIGCVIQLKDKVVTLVWTHKIVHIKRDLAAIKGDLNALHNTNTALEEKGAYLKEAGALEDQKEETTNWKIIKNRQEDLKATKAVLAKALAEKNMPDMSDDAANKTRVAAAADVVAEVGRVTFLVLAVSGVVAGSGLLAMGLISSFGLVYSINMTAAAEFARAKKPAAATVVAAA